MKRQVLVVVGVHDVVASTTVVAAIRIIVPTTVAAAVRLIMPSAIVISAIGWSNFATTRWRAQIRSITIGQFLLE